MKEAEPYGAIAWSKIVTVTKGLLARELDISYTNLQHVVWVMLFTIDYSIEETLRKSQRDDNGNVAKQKDEQYNGFTRDVKWPNCALFNIVIYDG